MSAIKFGESLSKFMIPIALLEKFGTFITGIEISHLTRHSSKPNKLRNINPIRGRTGNVTIQKWKIYKKKKKKKSSRLSYILDETNPFEIDKCKSKNGASESGLLALFNCSSGG